MSSNREGGLTNEQPKTTVATNRSDGQELDSMPEGGSEKVGAAYNPGTLNTSRNVIIGAVFIAIMLALVLFFVILPLIR